MKTSHVYIMASATRTTYIGVTTDLEVRVWEHKTHAYDGFTKRYNITKLVYIEEFSRIDDAIAWEKALKGKTRAKKIAVIEERNPRWNDLAWNWYGDLPAEEAPPAVASAVTCSSRGDSSPPAQNDGMLGTHPKT
jgi:predicted GIY-YIG superfamily endonuclease